MDDVLGEFDNDDEEWELPDFSGVQEYTALKGEFPARITEIKGTQNNDGAPAIIVTWTIFEGEHEGRTANDRWNLRLNRGSGFLKGKMRVLGIEGQKLTRKLLMGKEALVVLAPQKDNDDYHEVKKIKPLPKKGL